MNMPQNDHGALRSPDKMTVFQKCVSNFNQSTVSVDKARALLTDLVHLFYLGETFPEAEATQLFFTITKLFQKENVGLKQMVYLAIKELVPLTDNVIMGTSVLMRDVQQKSSTMDSRLYKPMALRALCSILDASAVESMDRLMRSSIVDRDGFVSSAALVSSYHLLEISRETVKRWSNEVSESMKMPASQIAQYHALGLLYEMRAQDNVALLKLVVSLDENNVLRDANAMALHVRYIGQLLTELGDHPQLLPLLKVYLRNRSDIASIEALKTILAVCKNEEIVAEAMSVLNAYLESPRAISRFAGIRILNRYASVRPDLIAEYCNSSLENLITDSNTSIATYAISVLLKTGSASSVDRLIHFVTKMLTDIPEDFRLVVVDAVRSLAKRFPNKHKDMLEFFADSLRQEGGLTLKLAIVEAISDVLGARSVDTLSDSVDQALLMLCETIEDSEYPEVTVRVLHLLGEVGPASSNASTLVRFIYNRVILENSVVRAAAVSALARFQDCVPDVHNLLERSCRDVNDEVRDRAAVALVIPVPQISKAQQFSIADLEKQVQSYLESPENFSAAFDISKVAMQTDEERQRQLVPEALDEPVPSAVEEKVVVPAVDKHELLAALVEAVPEIADLGELLHSTAPSSLTDDDMEYIVSARLHVFPQHLVAQYDIRNNFDLEISNVSMETDLDFENELVKQFGTTIPTLQPYSSDSLYVAFTRDGTPVGEIPSTMRFVADGSDEDYALDDFEITASAYVVPSSVADFDAKFAELDNEETGARQFATCKTIADSVSLLKTRLGMFPVSGTDIVPEDANIHTLKLFGVSLEGDEVAAVVRLVSSSRGGIAGKAKVHSSNPDLSFTVVEGL